jgi:hypothetical protein
MNIDALARDYFRKQEIYRELIRTSPFVEMSDRANHEFAERDALDALAEASMKLDAARRAERQMPERNSYEIGSGGPT